MEMGRDKKVRLSRSWTAQQSPISQLLFGQFRSVVRKAGSKESVTNEPFNCLSLDIHSPSVHTLQEAIAFISQPETIGSSESSKSSILGIRKTVTIQQVPPVLIIQLKRFHYDSIKGSVKSTKCISYPTVLDFFGSGHQQAASQLWDLHAVVYHHGRGAAGGHYTCHVSVQDQERKSGSSSLSKSARSQRSWYYFNDAVVELCDEQRVLAAGSDDSVRSCTPYLLVYIRRDCH